MNNFIANFREFFAPLNTAQRFMFVGLIVVILASVTALFYWAQKPDYTLLFGSLHHESAQEITQELDSRGIEYRIEGGGQSIYVQSDKVDELRLALAPMGASQADVKGYELFDENSLGMTDFMQQVNKKRALEGELARSINSLDQVESSRIHLALPERTPFSKTSSNASASCILNLRSGQSLSEHQIVGITSLIAGSVEGLTAANVTVLDQVGNRLTDGMNNNSDFASSSEQMQVRQKTESYLTERGQTMLDRVLGPGNSILRVSVEHDFDRLVRESDLIDPDSRMIISEERSSEVNSDEDLQPVEVDEFTPMDRRGETMVVSRQDNEVTTQTRNYEVNKTREVFEKTQGEIKHLSASVLINYKQVEKTGENGEATVVNEPYSPEEIEEFKETVSLALGIQENRGDQLSIKQIEFFTPTNISSPRHLLEQPLSWYEILRWSLVALSFLVIIFLVKSIKNRMGEDQSIGVFAIEADDTPGGALKNAGGNGPEGVNAHEELQNNKLDGNVLKQLQEKQYVMEEIEDFVSMKPEKAASVVRALMVDDE